MPVLHLTKAGRSKDFDTNAFYDKLTQLPNRHLLYDRLGQEMASSERTGDYMALMFILHIHWRLDWSTYDYHEASQAKPTHAVWTFYRLGGLGCANVGRSDY